MQRAVELTDSGTQDLSSIVLTTSASRSSLLNTDTTNGLQPTIQSCSSAWAEAGISPAFTYTCGGTISTVLAPRPARTCPPARTTAGRIGAGRIVVNLMLVTALLAFLTLAVGPRCSPTAR